MFDRRIGSEGPACATLVLRDAKMRFDHRGRYAAVAEPAVGRCLRPDALEPARAGDRHLGLHGFPLQQAGAVGRARSISTASSCW